MTDAFNTSGGVYNSTPRGRNALFCVRRYQCALSDIVFSISDISVDAVVDRYVSSGISGAQRRESEFLRELIIYHCHCHSLYLTMSAICFFCQSDIAELIEHVCVSSFSVFIFLLR